MKYWLGSVLAIGVCWLVQQPVAAESTLRIQPLQNEATLQKGERKKGYIDITNPQPQAVTVELSVAGFRQIDTAGNLSFYNSEQLRAGITLDYEEYTIPAEKTLRLFYVVDGTKLPTGDVFAAIFARTINASTGSASSSVRLGSLLILTNGTTPARQAEIVGLSAPWLQTGADINGKLTIKNTAPADSASGFFPEVTIGLWPFGQTTSVKGPLVFAGNSREMKFAVPSNQLGIYKLSVGYGDSRKSQWMLVITGVWRWVVLALVAMLPAAIFILIKLSRRYHRVRKERQH
jgi:hypothetical protein